MFPLIPVALGGAMLVSALSLNKKKNNQLRLRKRLKSGSSTVVSSPHKTGKANKKSTTAQRFLTRVLVLEQRYQSFVQDNIDPLLGKTRQMQLKEFTSAGNTELTQEERYANLRIGIGGLALGAALIGRFLYAPFMAVAILLGSTIIATFYYIAYLEWRRTRRLGAIHLTCVYDAFLWLGGYATFGALGMFLIGIGLKIKAMTESQSRNNLNDIFQLQPGKVWVQIEGSEIEIPFEKLLVGDILVLRGGQVVPVDGTVVSGMATLDQHVLTGEGQPVEKEVGDKVFASTLLISGTLYLRVEQTGTETTAGRLAAILEETAKYNAATTLKIIEISDRFAWPTLALSAASWPVLGPASAVSIMGANSTFNTYITGSVVVLNFLNRAAERAVLIKDCKALEDLNTVDLVVFDKTGTLTMEIPSVGSIHAFEGLTEEAVLVLAAAAETRQTHPIARAILAAAEHLELDLPILEDVHYELGFGLKVQLADEGKLLRVGSDRFMKMEKITLPEDIEQLIETAHTQGYSLLMVALEDVLVGCIELQPTIRPEAQQIVHGLQERGVTVCIVSGDQEGPTRKLAEEFGITNYFANILPEGKAELVTRFQKAGRQVCFIGDGINDAIAMRKAEVSISLRGATTAATDAAQIILMDGSLSKLPELFVLAGQFERRLAHNFKFTAGVSIMALTGIFLAGFTFAATEILYVVSLLGGLGIAMQPTTHPRLLDNEKMGKDPKHERREHVSEHSASRKGKLQGDYTAPENRRKDLLSILFSDENTSGANGIYEGLACHA
jgi:heavy metal translocating P-type ATPase